MAKRRFESVSAAFRAKNKMQSCSHEYFVRRLASLNDPLYNAGHEFETKKTARRNRQENREGEGLYVGVAALQLSTGRQDQTRDGGKSHRTAAGRH